MASFPFLMRWFDPNKREKSLSSFLLKRGFLKKCFSSFKKIPKNDIGKEVEERGDYSA
jgi:hypothetical protein